MLEAALWGSVSASAEQRASQTRRAAVALSRDLLAAVHDDIHACALHALAGLGVPVERERSPRPQCEHIRALRLELVVGNLDDPDTPLGEQLEETYGRDPRVDQREVAV